MQEESRQAGDPDGFLTPEALQDFEDLFDRWKDDPENSDLLEMGGRGDLNRLARLVMRWSLRHFRRALQEDEHD